MYLDYFDLTEQPFNMTPDPRFFYFSKKHEEALSNLIFGISERKGFITITGEIGTGKTTLCRLLLNRLDKKVKTSLIFNPNLTTIELLQAINGDFGIENRGISKKELVDNLNIFLLDVLKERGNAVLIIDEAQNLTTECLEEVRMLSNLETERDKLLQIILVGQPELRKKLELERLKQLNQRIALRYHLEPFDEKEMKEYIMHRLRIAGSNNSVFFTQQAIDKVYEYSHGTPRLINLLCDKTLLAAFVAGTKSISNQIVQSAIKELRGDRFFPERKAIIFSSNAFSKREGIYKPISIIVILACVILTFFVIFWHKTALIGAISGNSRAGVNQRFTEDQDVKGDAVMPGYDKDGIFRIKEKKDSLQSSVMTLLKIWRVGFMKNDIASLRDDKELIEIMRDLGFETQNVTDLNKIIVFDYPAIINISGDGGSYYAVLRQINNEDATILDPLMGKMVYNLKELSNRWKGEGIILWKRIDGINAPMSNINPNSEVMALQEILKNKGIYDGKIDGYYGSITDKSVSELQLKWGLSPTGNFDIETHMILSRGVRGKAVPSLKNLNL
ncbi:MAG: AAA family ATPase [Nitrospirae bacterium]|nr:AAA family ATPase [Nitrospirota bacterium]